MRRLAALSCALVILASPATSQDTYTPAPENLKARAWFQEARFGLFIHWGVYSVAGDGEWVMQNKRITGLRVRARLRPRLQSRRSSTRPRGWRW